MIVEGSPHESLGIICFSQLARGVSNLVYKQTPLKKKNREDIEFPKIKVKI